MAPLSVINALVVALCMKKQNEVVTTLETLEKIWGEYQVYSADELNPVSGDFTVKDSNITSSFADGKKGKKDE